MSSSTKRPTILVVDDDPVDRRLIALSFKRAGAHVDLAMCEDGDTALEYLNQSGRFADASRPDACMFDINMPGISGIDLLRKVKRDPELRSIPVTMFSSSDRDEDIAASYDNNASYFVRKPEDPDVLAEIATTLSQLWSRTVSFPSQDAAAR